MRIPNLGLEHSLGCQARHDILEGCIRAFETKSFLWWAVASSAVHKQCSIDNAMIMAGKACT